MFVRIGHRPQKNGDENMVVVQTSDKGSADYSKRPRIEKGYYAAKLLGVKPLANKEGTPIESPFKDGGAGRRMIFEFAICDKKTFEPVVFKDDNVEKDLVIPLIVYSEYKNNSGEWRSAITPDSRITKTLLALGMKKEDLGKPFDTDTLLGNWCEVNIDDYEAKEKDGSGTVTGTYKASGIKDVGVLENAPKEGETSPSVASSIENATVEKTITHADIEIQKKLENLKLKKESLQELLKEGKITEDGFKMSMESIIAEEKQLTN